MLNQCFPKIYLESHKSITHEEKLAPLDCALCPCQFRTDLELEAHLEINHSKEEHFMCTMCAHKIKKSKKSEKIKHVDFLHQKLRQWFLNFLKNYPF